MTPSTPIPDGSVVVTPTVVLAGLALLTRGQVSPVGTRSPAGTEPSRAI